MPFITVKMYKGRTDEQKKELIKKITDVTAESVSCGIADVQIAIEEFDRINWGISGKSAAEK